MPCSAVIAYKEPSVTKRLTLHGHKATRRIKWYSPKDVVKKDGKCFVDVFVVAVIEEDGYRLVAVTSQIGIDRNNRQVLPYNLTLPKDGRFAYGGKTEGTSVTYAIGAEVGKLQDAGEALVSALNSHKNQWTPVAGSTRGILNPIEGIQHAAE